MIKRCTEEEEEEKPDSKKIWNVQIHIISQVWCFFLFTKSKYSDPFLNEMQIMDQYKENIITET